MRVAGWTVRLMSTPSRSVTGFQSHLVDSDVCVGSPARVSDVITDLEVEASSPEMHNTSSNTVVNSAPEVSTENQEQFLSKIHQEIASRFPSLCFAMSRVEVNSTQIPVLTISQRHLSVHLPHGMLSRIQGYVQYKEYSVHVMMRLWRKQSFESTEDIVDLCKIIGGNSHKFCPGIDPELYLKEYKEVIRFDIKSVRLTDFPFHRVHSVKCDLLFELARNATKEEKDAKEVKCYPCKDLVRHLERQKTRTLKETPTRKAKRQRPSSRARLSYMSPASQAKRKKLAQYERTNSIRKLARYEEHEVTLDDDQNEEMRTVMEMTKDDEELQRLYDEGEKYGVGGIMKEIWNTDLDCQRTEFSRDQASNSKIIIRVCICLDLFK